MTLKFYEFTGEYYALIKAFSKEEAIAFYKENVCAVDSRVVQVSMQYAWETVKPWIGVITIENFVANRVDVILSDLEV
ncbi:hypothetical protein EP56_08505 [Listeriaceae bacterium FSL A5-0209]|nr:hypothetical protein EP56_08505 [Listeriaceae bacterium FSL A5-0209]